MLPPLLYLLLLLGGFRLAVFIMVDWIERASGAADTRDHGALAVRVLGRDEKTLTFSSRDSRPR